MQKDPKWGKLRLENQRLADYHFGQSTELKSLRQIIKEIEDGVEPQYFSKYTSISGSKRSNKNGDQICEPKDIVVVAGKGHENYQEINGEKHHFDDKETIQELLQLMGK